MTTEIFYRTVMETSGVSDPTRARRVTAAVFHALRDRITQPESDQLFAQLPWELQTVWVAGERSERKPVKLHRQAFYNRVKQEAGLSSAAEARAATLAVFSALKKQISPGEADDVLAQLPKDLKEVWEEAKVPV
jgi:uncharacterized protein (DUF2267 family)